jgi:hypothetical protein
MAASFSFSNRTVSPTVVRPMETITASVDVTNTGDTAGSTDVHLTGWWSLTRKAYPTWNGSLAPVPTIQPGETKTVTFTFAGSTAAGANEDCAVIIEGELAGYVDIVLDGIPTKAAVTIITQDDAGVAVAAGIYVNGQLAGTTAGGPLTLSLGPGTYTIAFGQLPDHETPASQTLSGLLAGDSQTVTGIYTRIESPAAGLRVTLADGGPEAADLYLDEELPQTVHAGTPLDLVIDPGGHHLEFGDIDGYTTPSAIDFNAQEGQVYLLTVTYVPASTPPVAVDNRKLLYAAGTAVGLLTLVMLVTRRRR